MIRVQDPSEDVVFRPTSARILAYTWYVLAAVGAVDLLLRGDGRAVVVGLAVITFVTAVTYTLAHRPAVVATVDGVVLRNVVRDVFIPWPLVDHVGSAWSLVIETPDGRRYPSWAVSSGSPLGQALRARRSAGRESAAPEGPPGAPGSSRGKSTFDVVRENLRWMRQRALERVDLPPSAGDVEVRVVWPVVALLAGTALAMVLAIAL